MPNDTEHIELVNNPHDGRHHMVTAIQTKRTCSLWQARFDRNMSLRRDANIAGFN